MAGTEWNKDRKEQSRARQQTSQLAVPDEITAKERLFGTLKQCQRIERCSKSCSPEPYFTVFHVIATLSPNSLSL